MPLIRLMVKVAVTDKTTLKRISSNRPIDKDYSDSESKVCLSHLEPASRDSQFNGTALRGDRTLANLLADEQINFEEIIGPAISVSSSWSQSQITKVASMEVDPLFQKSQLDIEDNSAVQQIFNILQMMHSYDDNEPTATDGRGLVSDNKLDINKLDRINKRRGTDISDVVGKSASGVVKYRKRARMLNVWLSVLWMARTMIKRFPSDYQ